MDKSYDIAVAYRIYPGISKSPVIFPDNKLKLSEFCLKSFKNALGGLNAKIFAILDDCPDEYIQLFEKYFDKRNLDFIRLPGLGNSASFGVQMDILLNQVDSDYVYFAEDDYFYLEGCFPEMLDFLKLAKKADFVTPYDHIDYYNMKFHKYRSENQNFRNRSWRSAASTCMTFLTKKERLKEASKTFYSYVKNNYDMSLWMSLTKFRVFNLVGMLGSEMMLRIYLKAYFHCFSQILFGKKHYLWVPVPGMATHVEKTGLSPGYDWEAIFQSCSN